MLDNRIRLTLIIPATKPLHILYSLIVPGDGIRLSSLDHFDTMLYFQRKQQEDYTFVIRSISDSISEQITELGSAYFRVAWFVRAV